MHLSPIRTEYLLSSGAEGNIITAVFSHWAITPRGGNMCDGIFKQMILNLSWFVNISENSIPPQRYCKRNRNWAVGWMNLVCWVERVLLDRQAVFLSPACQKITEVPCLEQITRALPREFSEIHSNGNQYPIMRWHRSTRKLACLVFERNSE